MALQDRIAALMGLSAWDARRSTSAGALSPEAERRAREAQGGAITPLSTTRLRWYIENVESASRSADLGEFAAAAQLMRYARSDGVYSGSLQTRTGGVVRLPRKFSGDQKIIDELEKKHDGARSVFDEMLPRNELSLLVADGFELGFGLAEFVEVKGRSYPILVRLNPEFVRYSVAENRWFYNSSYGLLEIFPGNGRWVLHIQGGRMNPWQNAAWKSIARSVIRKDHAKAYRDNWIAKLANAARAAISPHGAGEKQKAEWFEQVMAWGVNTVFGMTPGFDVKLVESNGRGYEGFQQVVKDENEEIVITVCGQTVTTDGGAGFQNGDLFKSIRGDLIEESATSIAQTINTQCLPQYVVDHFGIEALENGVSVEYDYSPPKDKNSEATAMSAAAGAIKSLSESLASHDIEVDARQLALIFGVPLTKKKPQRSLETVREFAELLQKNGSKLTPEVFYSLAERLGLEIEESEETETTTALTAPQESQ